MRCSLECLGLDGGWGDDGLDVASVAAKGADASPSTQVRVRAAAWAPDAEGLPSGVLPEQYAAWQGQHELCFCASWAEGKCLRGEGSVGNSGNAGVVFQAEG